MILIKAIDYNTQELLTIRITIGKPTTGSIRVFDHLDREIEIIKILLNLDELTETYEATIITNKDNRIVTIVGIETI